MNKERRTTLRVPFVAFAEITEAGANTSIGVRISDISKNGCYVDLRPALPEGTVVRIKIRTAVDICEADATVGYTHPNLGMGLVFTNVSPESQAVLQKWIEFGAQESRQAC
jgi:hypothetical protein